MAFENVEDAWQEGIDYIELRFSPLFMAEPHQLEPEGVVEAVIEGVSEATSKYEIRANLIGIISRTYGPDLGWKELESLTFGFMKENWQELCLLKKDKKVPFIRLP